jgi:hypothetical protein
MALILDCHVSSVSPQNSLRLAAALFFEHFVASPKFDEVRVGPTLVGMGDEQESSIRRVATGCRAYRVSRAEEASARLLLRRRVVKVESIDLTPSDSTFCNF